MVRTRQKTEQTTLDWSSSSAPTLRIEPVPASLAIAPGRYYITIHHKDTRWHIPIQFRIAEARQILRELLNLRLRWELDEGGIPIDVWNIYAGLKLLLDGGQGDA